MKTKSIVLSVLMLLVSVFAFASDPSNSQLVVLNTNTAGVFKVIYHQPGENSIAFKVYNQQGEIVFADYIRASNGFIRPLNFFGMESGNYKVELKSGKQVTEQIIVYATESVNEKVESGAVKSIHVSKLAGENKYLLAISNQGTNRVNVRIFNGNKEMVYNRNMNINGDLGVVYSLKQLVGTPTFEVSDKNVTASVTK
ncbi:MAG: hypothetical protein ACK5TU_10685 [Cyclobacteriaceae bacterium]|jgi:hypothetical protein